MSNAFIGLKCYIIIFGLSAQIFPRQQLIVVVLDRYELLIHRVVLYIFCGNGYLRLRPIGDVPEHAQPVK